MAVAICVLHGAIFLENKTAGELRAASHKTAVRAWPITLILVVAAVIGTYLSTDIVTQLGVNPGMVPLIGLGTLLLVGYLLRIKKTGWAFIMTSVTILFTMATYFLVLFPNVMVSSTDPAYNLTIYNASSTPYTLQVMTIVALIFVPIVLIYQGWSFYIFRARVTEESHLEY
jgi:cytochrome d ubiquinol oxidase subunit II